MQAKVLTVSDGVADGTRDDKSGRALAERLAAAGYDVVDQRVSADGVDNVAAANVRTGTAKVLDQGRVSAARVGQGVGQHGQAERVEMTAE